MVRISINIDGGVISFYESFICAGSYIQLYTIIEKAQSDIGTHHHNLSTVVGIIVPNANGRCISCIVCATPGLHTVLQFKVTFS